MAKIGMVHFHFNGLDGVTLQAHVVGQILQRAGHEILWYGGYVGDAYHPAITDPLARHDSPENRELEIRLFGPAIGSFDKADTLATLRSRADALRPSLERFAAEVDLIIPQNVLCLPMNVPLSLALKEMLEETGQPAVAHNHDFAWERTRFNQTTIGDILHDVFPPDMANLKHFVINRAAVRDLADKRGIEAAAVLPNVMDFSGGWHRDPDGMRFRRFAGLNDDDVIFLQPTRTVPRKNIERAIELVADQRINYRNRHAVLVVTHEIADEGPEYVNALTALARKQKVDLRFCQVESESHDSTVTDLADAYDAANLVTYFSTKEGFGNAVIEAMYYKAPLIVNRYEQWIEDIEPFGADVITVDAEPITDAAIAQVQKVLDDRSVWTARAEHNYKMGLEHFSYESLTRIVQPIIDEMLL